MTDEELQEMIDEADRDDDGEIDESEFLRIMVNINIPLVYHVYCIYTQLIMLQQM